MSKKFIAAIENSAGTVSNATSELEQAFAVLRSAAANHNKGFLPPGIRDGFPKAIEALDALFAALSNAQS